MRNLTAGVYSGVGSPLSHDGNAPPQYSLQGRFDGTLNCGMVRLDLPAEPVGSQVFDIETVCEHFFGVAYLGVSAQQR